VAIFIGGSTGLPINPLSVFVSLLDSILMIRCSKSEEYLTRMSAPGAPTIP
jgi:hypothetical protein